LAGEKGTIQIYSMEGRLINTLFENKVQQMGDNEVLWKGVDYNNKKVSDGIYLIALQIGANSFFYKTLLIH
jgi:flagellar hook assembly protein FlgD